MCSLPEFWKLKRQWVTGIGGDGLGAERTGVVLEERCLIRKIQVTNMLAT